MLAPHTSHYVAVNIDAGPLLATMMVDGVLCDGGAGVGAAPPYTKAGWAWVSPGIGSLASVKQLKVGSAVKQGHLWGRSLYTSEIVGAFRTARAEASTNPVGQ